MNDGKWISGPWDNEPDHKIMLFNFDGLSILGAIHRVPWSGHLCGYVRLPDGMELKNDMLSWDVDVHWGITYEGNGQFVGLSLPDGNYIGFDANHSGDLSPRDATEFPNNFDSQYRDMDFMTEQVKYLAEQIAKIFTNKSDSSDVDLSPCLGGDLA